VIDLPSTWFTAHPHWHWLVVLYFFFGGLAGGCYVLAAVIDLFGRSGDRPLARVAYLTVLPCLGISALALIFDLSRPDRFWHLLVEIHTGMPLFQWWTPMNSGAWVLLAFSLLALLSALAAAAEAGWLPRRGLLRLRPPGVLGTVVAVLGALLGLYVASYEGMLLGFTSRPIWSETPFIGPVLVLTALAMAAAYLMLFARWRRWELPGLRALQHIEVQALAVALLVLVALVFSLGGSARALLSPLNLILLVALFLVGFAAPLFLRLGGSRMGWQTAAAPALLALTGGFLLRTFIVFSPYGAGS
jgi:formate-dependent nitrite reductase membrane component NrfD